MFSFEKEVDLDRTLEIIGDVSKRLNQSADWLKGQDTSEPADRDKLIQRMKKLASDLNTVRDREMTMRMF